MDVYRMPANLFVATFIGSPSMNLMEARFDGRQLKTACGEFTPNARHFKHLRDGGHGKVTLGVRPQYVRAADGAGSNRVSARVEVVEHLGAEKFVYLETAGLLLTARLEEHDVATEGDTACFEFDMEQVHVFGKDGANLLYAEGRDLR